MADIARIIAHVADENPLAARRLGRDLLLAGDSLTVFPRRGRKGITPGTRELLIVRPYIVVYEVDERDQVTLLRIWHSSQDRGQ